MPRTDRYIFTKRKVLRFVFFFCKPRQVVVVFVVAKRRHYDTKKNIGIVLYFERYLRLVVPVDISLAITIIVVVTRRR